jgi:hypothetical protein
VSDHGCVSCTHSKQSCHTRTLSSSDHWRVLTLSSKMLLLLCPCQVRHSTHTLSLSDLMCCARAVRRPSQPARLPESATPSPSPPRGNSPSPVASPTSTAPATAIAQTAQHVDGGSGWVRCDRALCAQVRLAHPHTGQLGMELGGTVEISDAQVEHPQRQSGAVA